MADRRVGPTDWDYGTNLNNAASGNKDTAIRHIAIDGGDGVILGTAGNPVRTQGATGNAISTPSFSEAVNAAGAYAGSPTYRVGGSGYTAYATPTDLIGIRGSATKTIVVTGLYIRINTTVAAINTLSLIKRSTANTGGTVTNPVGVPVDSSQAASTAVIDLYTAAPTTGSAVGTVMIDHVASAASTNPGGIIALVAASTSIPQNPFMAADSRRGITLRGIGEGLYLNFAGAALGAGFSAIYNIEYIEY